MAKTGIYIVPTEAFHPGETLDEKLREMGLTNVEFAKVSGLDIDTVNGIVECKIDVNDRYAAILEKYTQIPSDFWLSKQDTFNRYRMEQLAKRLVCDIRKDPYGRRQQIKTSAENIYKYAASL